METVAENLMAGAEEEKTKRPAPNAKHPMGSRIKVDRQKMSVVVVRDEAALAPYISDWEDLAAEAIEPNPFYESWMLLPALRAFGLDKDLSFVLIFAAHPSLEFAPPVLCGFFPLERSHYRRLPVKMLRFWQHLHCFLCTPLIRRGYGTECLSLFFDWLKSAEAGSAVMEFNFVAGDGPFHQLLVDQLAERASLYFIAEQFTRALFRPLDGAENYLQTAISGKRRKELRRQEKRLAETGHYEYLELTAREELEASVEDFLRLEAEGWKGRAGTAMSANDREREFFRTIVAEAFQRERLMMLSARLDGRTVAQKCNFMAGAGAFAFKIAFDESYAQSSPGVHLEIENIRRSHLRLGMEWMDSCSVTDNFINSLWLDRRTISTTLVATGRSPGGFLVSFLPLLRWLNRHNPLRRRQKAKS
jgi:CelD/BcsL family acetyltransferase involved in cellulose biosynthesis